MEGTFLFRKQTRNKPTKTIPSLRVNERNFIFPGLTHCQSCGPGLWPESRVVGDRPPAGQMPEHLHDLHWVFLAKTHGAVTVFPMPLELLGDRKEVYVLGA